MTLQTEQIEEFRRFEAARAVARIATDRAYAPFSGVIVSTSGTAVVAEQFGPENADSITYVVVRRDDSPTRASGILVFSSSIAGASGDAVRDVESGEAAKQTDDLQPFVDHARSHGLQEVADRLVELNLQPLADDENQLQAASAMWFVNYCVARQKRARPLMTITPAGELDATWKGGKGERTVMRFFSSGSVWVAYKLLKERGSFETSVTDLLDPQLHFRIPEWA